MSDLYIDGAWVAPVQPAALEVVNPYDASILRSVDTAEPGEVALAVEAARRAFAGPWRETSAAQRAVQLRRLADLLVRAEHPRQALAAYEAQRLPATAEIVAMNRAGGPERVIDAVEELAPNGFDDVERVLSYAKREMIVKTYAGKAGFAKEQLAPRR